MISVIIPTRNRADYLKDALESILMQTLQPEFYEVIVIDNGSVDNTWEIVDKLNLQHENRIKYIFEEEPGLHVGRHRGAKEARGGILVYADDDTIAFTNWLESISSAFNDPEVVLVGGKVLPKWEGQIPEWINLFKSKVEWGWTIGYLSLLDFGDETKIIPPCYVYGCNYSIRKTVLFACGGFHPDGMPRELIQYRGDGESAPSVEIKKRGYKALYEPKASVFHRVPSERLSVDYFCRRAFNQGVSDSYTEIRAKYGLTNVFSQPSNQIPFQYWEHIKKMIRFFLFWKSNKAVQKHPVIRRVNKAYTEGKSFHRKKAEQDPELLKYILKEDYFS